MIAQWYIARGKQKLGPFSFRELKELARTGGLLPIEMVIEDGTKKWRSASEIEELFWRTSEDVIQGIPISPSSTVGPSTAPTPPGSEEVIEGQPLPHFSPSPTPLGLALTGREHGENQRERDEAASPPANPAPLVVPPIKLEERVEAPPLPSPSAPPASAVAPAASTNPEENRHSEGKASEPGPAIDSDGLLPRNSEGPQQKVQTIEKPIATWKRLLKWGVAAAGLAVVIGLIGDFLRPLAPFNLIGFLSTAGFAVFLIVFRAKRGKALDSSFGAVCVISVAFAGVFASWWTLAHFKGSREKGYLAKHSRFIGRLQSAIVLPVEGEELVGDWVLRSDGQMGTLKAELSLKDGEIHWTIYPPNTTSPIRIRAEYGVARDGLLYGVVTQINDLDSGEKRTPKQL